MVSLRFTYAKLATVIRLYSPVQYIFEERARNWLEDPRLPFPFPPLPCLSCAHPVPFDYFSSNIQRNGDRFCVEFAESMEPTYLGGWYILARIEEVMNKESGGSVNGILARYRKRRAFEISVVSWRGNVENNWTINRTMFARIQVVVVVVIVVDKCELSQTRWKTFAFPRTRD